MTFAAALAASAAEQGLELAAIADPDEPNGHATVASVVPMRDPLGVGAGPWPDNLYFEGWGLDIEFITGDATDLGELARVAHAWQTGVPVRQIHALAPYSTLGPLAEAAEQGPAEVIAQGWAWIQAVAADRGWEWFTTLVQCAYAEPRLRQCFPYTGMGSITFMAEVLPFARPVARIDPTQNGFTVSIDELSWDEATPQEAVARVRQIL